MYLAPLITLCILSGSRMLLATAYTKKKPYLNSRATLITKSSSENQVTALRGCSARRLCSGGLSQPLMLGHLVHCTHNTLHFSRPGTSTKLYSSILVIPASSAPRLGKDRPLSSSCECPSKAECLCHRFLMSVRGTNKCF